MVDPTMTGLAAVAGAVAMKLGDAAIVWVRRRNGKSGNAQSFDPTICRTHGEAIASTKATVEGLSETITTSLARIETQIGSIEETLRNRAQK